MSFLNKVLLMQFDMDKKYVPHSVEHQPLWENSKTQSALNEANAEVQQAQAGIYRKRSYIYALCYRLSGSMMSPVIKVRGGRKSQSGRLGSSNHYKYEFVTSFFYL